MNETIPPIADDPKEALAQYIDDLERNYYPWYERAMTRNYYCWFTAQAVSLLSGFATSLVAAIFDPSQISSWGLVRVSLVVMPLIGSLASTYLVQARVAELEALRENGRQTIQRLANDARLQFATASAPQDYTEIHKNLLQQVTDLEEEQSRTFQRLVPKQMSFGSSNRPFGNRRSHV